MKYPKRRNRTETQELNESGETIRKTGSSRKRHVVIGLVIVLSAVTLAWASSPLMQRLDQGQEIRALEQEQSSNVRANKILKKDIKRLKWDPLYIELLARKDLGLVMSDEEAFVVINPEKQVSKPLKRQRPPKTLWQNIEKTAMKLLRL